MPLGLEVRLVNISRSGLLIESRGRFVVGQPAAFELHGRLRVVVPGRFVRSAATQRPDGRGRRGLSLGGDLRRRPAAVRAARARRARAGAIITQRPRRGAGVGPRRRRGSGMRPERIRAAFELSVQELVGARAVLICRAPAQADEPGDSVCLPVPTSDGSEAFLQAIYDTARPPSSQRVRAPQGRRHAGRRRARDGARRPRRRAPRLAQTHRAA